MKDWKIIFRGFSGVLKHEWLLPSIELQNELLVIELKYTKSRLSLFEFPDTILLFNIIKEQKEIIRKYEKLQKLT